MDLSVDLGRLHLKNPLLAASGTFGFGKEEAEFFDLSILGGIVTKSITIRPRVGNPPPRIVETPAGMLNAIGLANPGVEKFIGEELPFLRSIGTRIIVSIAGETVEEYENLAAILRKEGVEALELNISCPNVAKGGLCFSMDVSATREVVSRVRRSTDSFLITKLSPNVTDIRPFVEACVGAGTDALSLVNTFLGMAVDWKSRQGKLANLTGGLSGPAIRPLALRLVYDAVKASAVPVIGVGGIVSADDVLEFMVTGATCVEIGTGNFLNPTLMREILRDLERKLTAEGISRIRDIIGTLREGPASDYPDSVGVGE